MGIICVLLDRWKYPSLSAGYPCSAGWLLISARSIWIIHHKSLKSTIDWAVVQGLGKPVLALTILKWKRRTGLSPWAPSGDGESCAVWWKEKPQAFRAGVWLMPIVEKRKVLIPLVHHACHSSFMSSIVTFRQSGFVSMEKLAKLDCWIVNAQVDGSHISQYKTNIHYSVFWDILQLLL